MPWKNLKNFINIMIIEGLSLEFLKTVQAHNFSNFIPKNFELQSRMRALFSVCYDLKLTLKFPLKP